MSCFHVELRQFPHSARAFNLSEQELRTRVLERWAGGEEVEWEGQRFSPRRAKLRILRGPELAPHELGMGRGWQQAERTGEDVTSTLLGSLAPPPATSAGEIREQVLAAAAEDITLGQITELVLRLQPQRPASEAAAIAEQVVAQLLRAGELGLRRRT